MYNVDKLKANLKAAKAELVIRERDSRISTRGVDRVVKRIKELEKLYERSLAGRAK